MKTKTAVTKDKNVLSIAIVRKMKVIEKVGLIPDISYKYNRYIIRQHSYNCCHISWCYIKNELKM